MIYCNFALTKEDADWFRAFLSDLEEGTVDARQLGAGPSEQIMPEAAEFLRELGTECLSLTTSIRVGVGRVHASNAHVSYLRGEDYLVGAGQVTEQTMLAMLMQKLLKRVAKPQRIVVRWAHLDQDDELQLGVHIVTADTIRVHRFDATCDVSGPPWLEEDA